MSHDGGDPVECSQCGGMALHYSCWNCFGEGEFDLYDDNPNEYEPGDVKRCDVCNGRGGYVICRECDIERRRAAWPER